MIIAGQSYETHGKTLYANIREPFYSAGRQFHWLGVTVGLGLSKDALMYAYEHGLEFIEVSVGTVWSRKRYQASVVDWITFAEENKSIMQRGGVIIYVLQWNNQHFKTIVPEEYVV